MTKEDELDQIEYRIKLEEWRLKLFKQRKHPIPLTYALLGILAKTKDLFKVVEKQEFEQKGESLLRLSILKTEASLLLKDFNRQERIKFKS